MTQSPGVARKGSFCTHPESTLSSNWTRQLPVSILYTVPLHLCYLLPYPS